MSIIEQQLHSDRAADRRHAITLVHDIEIEASAYTVWQVVADYARDQDWRRGVRSMVPTPPGLVRVGTTTVEYLRLGGRTWRNDGEVVSVEPGHRFAWRTTAGADARGSRTVEEVGPGRTRVRLELVVTPRGPERLMRPFLARMLDRNLRGDLGRLGAVVRDG